MRVSVTHPERVLYPEAGFTKRDLVEYYRSASARLLPHLEGRALTLGRWPDGVGRGGFAQTECRGAPPWMTTAEVRLKSGAVRRQCVVDGVDSLLWVANQGTIELHVPLHRAGAPEEPTAILFDLDPGPPADVLDCCRVGLEIRDRLDREGLPSWAKTSGGWGVHVLADCPGPSYAEAKRFARRLAEELAREHPGRVVATSRRALRGGRVLIDWMQNDPSRTTIAAHSLRAMAWPTVSMPVAWALVERALAEARPDLVTFVAARRGTVTEVSEEAG